MLVFHQVGGFKPLRYNAITNTTKHLANGKRVALMGGMRYTKLALYAALLSSVVLTPAYGRGGGGGGGHVGGGGVARGGFSGGYRGGVGVVGGYRGGYYGGRGYYYGGRYFYGGPGLYVGLGGWYYPYGYYAPYAYDPYYYDPYNYGYQVGPSAPAQPYPQQTQPYPQQTQPYPQQGQPYPQQAPPQQTQPQAATGNQGNYFLIEFNDHTIQAATAYKVEGDQIHWITRDGKEHQAPVSSVDIADSQKLNSDRNVEFKIP